MSTKQKKKKLQQLISLYTYGFEGNISKMTFS